jgi:hypothetical protein
LCSSRLQQPSFFPFQIHNGSCRTVPDPDPSWSFSIDTSQGTMRLLEI